MNLEAISELFSHDTLQSMIRHPQFIAFALTILLEFLRRIIVPKANVIWGTSHGFNFLIPQIPDTARATAIANLPISTRSIFVRNKGRAPAKNIEFIKHKEFFSIEAIHSRNIPSEIVNVRAEKGKCKKVKMAPVQIFSTPTNYTILALLFLGIYQLLLFFIYFVQYFFN